MTARVLMIFFDGWGLGDDDPERNPFLTTPMPALAQLLGQIPTRARARLETPRAACLPTDATLGVPGLPQSATGQTSLFTGVNAARSIGEHAGPYPTPALKQLLARDNLMQQLRTAGRRVAFANAYPPVFFERLARNSARRSATSHMVSAAGVRYRDIDDLRAGRALSAFITNDRWAAMGVDVPVITAPQAGANLARLAQEYDFSLFEYFLTDAAGHKGDREFTAAVLAEVNALLAGVLDTLDLDHTLLITTSDHGNVEDACVKGHTRNPVPTIVAGAGHRELVGRITSLTDITPAIVDYLT